MHLSARTNVGRPVNFRGQLMGRTPEAVPTNAIHLEDTVHQVGAAGVNLLAAEVFCYSS
jgi:hypothetical protein